MFKGSGVAIVTPFDKNNNVNYIELRKLIEFQIKNSTDAIIVCGTTGESSTLSEEEKKDIINFTVEVVKKRVPVIAGTGSNNTQNSINLSKCAEKLGADGLLIVTPYYNKCTQEGLYLHYKEIAKNVKIPIILYNVPSRTNVNIDIETVIRLSKIKNIIGIKEASSNISQISNLISKLDKNFFVYSGNDDQILPILSLGGSGVISVLANIYPKETHDICYEYLHGNIQKSRKLQLKYLDLIKCLFVEVNPIPVKEALNYLGFNVGKCRLPLSDMSNKNKENLINCLKKLQ